MTFCPVRGIINLLNCLSVAMPADCGAPPRNRLSHYDNAVRKVFMQTVLTEKAITAQSEDFCKVSHLYLVSFPKRERVPMRYLMQNTADSEFRAFYDAGEFCGFYSAITFGDITHILFLAVDENKRDHGYGSAILSHIAQTHPGQRLILDMEAVETCADNYEQRRERQAFYERNGYRESGIAYHWHDVHYVIMIHGGKISEEEFDAFWANLDEIRRKELWMDEMKVTFRKITKEDRKEFLNMSREFYASEAVLHPVDEANHEKAFDELMRSDVYLECYLIESDGMHVGYALLMKTYSREAGGLNIWIDELYVRPAYQGLGAGSAFFRFLEQTHPAARYRLETEPDNLRAQKLYHRLGYRDLPYLQMIKGN